MKSAMLAIFSVMLLVSRISTTTSFKCSRFSHANKIIRERSFMSAAGESIPLSKDVMIALAQRVKEVNDMNGIESIQKADFVPFKFDGLTYGYTSRSFANILGAYT